MKYFLIKSFGSSKNFLRSFSILSATLLLLFIVSSFTVKKKEISKNKPCAPTIIITCDLGNAGTCIGGGENTDVDYQLYNLGVPVGLPGTICAGGTVTVGGTANSISFNVAGSALTFSMTIPATCGSYSTTAYGNSGSCGTPTTPVGGLYGAASSAGATSHFDFN
jgi:hypothetical protein